MFNFETFASNNETQTRANLIDQDGVVVGAVSFTHELILDDESSLRFSAWLNEAGDTENVTRRSSVVWSGSNRPWLQDKTPGPSEFAPLYMAIRDPEQVPALVLEDDPLFLGLPAIDFEAAALKLYTLGKASTSSQEVA